LKWKPFFTWKGWLLWSNHFYGICGALLAMETTLTITHTIPSLYLLIFIYATILFYYSYAYLKESKIEAYQETKQTIYNERVDWYLNARPYLIARQWLIAFLLLYLSIYSLHFLQLIYSFNIAEISVVASIVVIILLYDFPQNNVFKQLQIRRLGFLKSISISWVWVFICCCLPLMVANKQGLVHLSNSNYIIYLFQQFIFILILAILFDIKDINKDADEFVKTIVVRYGVRNTIFRIVMPLLVLYVWLSMYLFFRLHPSFIYLFFPYLIAVLISVVIYSIQKRKEIHDNIFLIDGLMILKACIGILLAAYF